MAPLVQELRGREAFCCEVAVTAQHRQILDQVLGLFDVAADYDLDIMTHGQTLFDITSRALCGLGDVIKAAKPDMVLVHGDTTTTFAGALAAFYSKIAVGHVEAGLRTYDKDFPYPEEMNRRMTGALADIHFAPTATAKSNLLREYIKQENIFVTGNTVIDALKTTVKPGFKFTTQVLNTLDYEGKKVILVTAHRRENIGQPLKDICMGILDLVEEKPEVYVVYPVHPNPLVRETADAILGGHERILLLPPLDTDEMHNLMSHCYMVMTDSGGLQEEAPALGKPVLVLRSETERPAAVEAGTVKIVGTQRERVYEISKHLVEDAGEYKEMANAVNPYGDGLASRRIADALLYYFGKTDTPPDEF